MENAQAWKVLLVDDDEDDYLLTRAMLKQAQGRNVALDWAPTYSAGQERIQADHYDAVLVDYDLGARTGIDLIREAASRGYAAPLILFTGRGSYAVDVEAMQAGATLYLTKAEVTPLLLERSIRYAIERKRIEDELDKRLKERSDILESISDGFLALDRAWRITYINQRAARNGNFEPEELVGRKIWGAFPQLRGTELERNYRRVMESRLPVQFELRGVVRDLWYYVSVYPSAEGISVFWQDISDRKQAERELQESEQKYRNLVESLHEGVWVVDAEGATTFVNQQMAHMVGYSVEELSGKSLFDLMDEPGRQRAMQERETRRAGHSGMVEHDLIKKDGTRLSVLVATSPIFDPDGKFIGAIAGVLDNTAQKQAREELQAAHDELELHIHERTEALQIANEQLATTNEQLAQANRVLVEEIESRRSLEDQLRATLDALHEKNQALEDFNAELEARVIARTVELQRLNAGLTARNIELKEANQQLAIANEELSVSYEELKVANDQLEDLNAEIARQNEDLARVNQELEREIAAGVQKQDRLRVALVRSGITAFSQDDQLRYTWIHNPHPGFNSTEVLGKTDFDLLPEDDALQLVEIKRRVLETGQGARLEVRTTIDDAPFIYDLVVEPQRDERGQVTGVLCSAADITERMRFEAALRSYAGQLEQSNQELEQFAFVASHDLQEPLRKVEMFGAQLEASLEARLEEAERDYLERLQSASRRMRAMIEDLLALSRVISQGKPPIPIDLNAIAAAVLEVLEASIRETGGTVEVQELPVVLADPVQMRQLLQNLVANALKFHRPGVPPQVRICARATAPGQVEISVEDNGIGFDTAHLDRLFQPFQRLVGRSAYAGNGMGLAICRKIAERHGGSITATSIPGKGSTFTVTLPAETG